MVKMDAIAVEKGSKHRMKSELKDLKIGRQDPELFELPEGYSKMSMMPGFGSILRGDDGKDGEGDDGSNGGNNGTGQPAPQEKKKGFGWKNAVDILKKY